MSILVSYVVFQSIQFNLPLPYPNFQSFYSNRQKQHPLQQLLPLLHQLKLPILPLKVITWMATKLFSLQLYLSQFILCHILHSYFVVDFLGSEIAALQQLTTDESENQGKT